MTRLRGYLELARPANVVTALADVLAGYAIAGVGQPSTLAWLLLSTASLYAGGVVLNDYFDRALDAKERPERPIPSGRVPADAARRIGSGLLAVGVTAGWTANPIAGAVAAAIAAAVVLYDAWGKHQGLFGPINMGICRGLNLLLGIAAAPAALESAWTMAFLPLVYIAAVTAVSRGEVSGGPRGVGAFALISLSGVVMALAALSYSRGPSWIGLALALALSWRVLPAFWAAWQTPAPAPIRHAVRTGVLSLVLLDATIGAAFGGALWSVLILATGLVAASLARVFAVT